MINLPNPHPLLPSLIEAGLSWEVASAASKLYEQRAEEFKRRTETMLTAAWQKIAALPGASASSLDPLTRKDLSTSFTEVYLRCLEDWKEEIVQLSRQTLKIPSRAKAVSPRSLRSFNNEYLPLLEHFFEENPFPTHADKVFLAKKSNMEYKQIHIWFQNRRSRTKKSAKPLRKKPTSEDETRPLNRLCERKGHVVKPISQPSRAALSEVGNQIQSTQNSAFISPRPLHAFPSSYPPTCTYDPFPCKSGVISFRKPEWRRVSSPKPLSVFITIDDLVEKFSQLNVRDDIRIKRSPRLRSHAATTAITVIPSCAPHPSLIVHKQPKCPHVVLNCPLTRAPTSHLHTFQGHSATTTSKAVTLIPLSAPSRRREPSTR